MDGAEARRRGACGFSVAAAGLFLLAPACAGESRVADRAPPEPGPVGTAPQSPSADAGTSVALVREIALPELVEPAEGIYVDSAGILIVTAVGHYPFDAGGQARWSSGEAPTREPAMGVDGRPGRALAAINRDVLLWYDWEDGATLLGGAQRLSGVALAPATEGSSPSLLVTDAALGAVREHSTTGELMRELALPGTDLQGVAFSSRAEPHVLDASERRLLRLRRDLGGVEATIPLPIGTMTPTGLHFGDGDELYVCFRDARSVAVFKLDTRDSTPQGDRRGRSAASSPWSSGSSGRPERVSPTRAR